MLTIEARKVNVKKVLRNTNVYLSGYLESDISSKMEQLPRSGEHFAFHRHRAAFTPNSYVSEL
jgi:hypothetical protein